MTINKTVLLGRTDNGNFFAFIKYDGKRLSISGVVGPYANGNCAGSAGQCNNDNQFLSYAEGWNEQLAKQFFDVWKRWHLNDMRAGDGRQQQCIREAKADLRKINSHEDTCKILDDCGLLTHNGYKYSTQWLSEYIPADIITFLESLPANSAGLPTVWQK